MFFACEQWGSNKARHALHRIKTTFLTRYSSFSICLFFSMMRSSWSYESEIMFSFLLIPGYDVNLLMHRVERACTNCTCSTHDSFAYWCIGSSLFALIAHAHPIALFAYGVVYATHPSIQPCGLHEVYVVFMRCMLTTLGFLTLGHL